MDKTGSFSVVIPVYNAHDQFIKTYESVIRQKNVEVEVIAVDGGSEDTSIEYYEALSAQDKNFYYIYEKDNGIYDAMNKGMLRAHNAYCIFLGAGDLLVTDETLFSVSKEIQRSTPDIVYGYTIMRGEDTERIYKRKFNSTYPFRADPVSHQAVLSKRELLCEYPFDIDYKIAADQDWLMHMYMLKKKFVYIDLPITIYMLDGISASAHGHKRGQQEIRQIHKKYYPLLYYVHDLLRKINGHFFKINRNK
ncbi:MAG: glycosyltransferase [Lachnospiraceae bacterium]|nr:glycosyltransferase [Lachnospiraceae bacterium]